MGKFLKTCLILGIICIVIGFVASGAGVSLGGLNELKEQVLNGEWSFDAGIDPFFELEEQHYFDENEILNVDVDKEESFLAADIHEIHVKSAGVTVKFAEHDGEDIIVSTSKVNKYQAFVKEGELHVTARGQSTQNLGNGVVQIMVPAAVYAAGTLDMTVESAASVIEFGKMAAADVELDVSAGTISWSELKAQELSIEMAAGTVTGQNVAISGSTDIDLSAGTVEISGVLGTETDIEMTAGMVNIALADAYTDYNYDVSCAGGSVTVGDQKLEGLAKSLEVSNRAAKYIDVECSMGTVDISFVN